MGFFPSLLELEITIVGACLFFFCRRWIALLIQCFDQFSASVSCTVGGLIVD